MTDLNIVYTDKKLEEMRELRSRLITSIKNVSSSLSGGPSVLTKHDNLFLLSTLYDLLREYDAILDKYDESK